MLKRIRHFLGIYTKAEKFTNGYNTMLEAIKSRDFYLIQDLYYSAVDNEFDFDEFDRGIIQAYKEHYENNNIAKGDL